MAGDHAGAGGAIRAANQGMEREWVAGRTSLLSLASRPPQLLAARADFHPCCAARTSTQLATVPTTPSSTASPPPPQPSDLDSSTRKSSRPRTCSGSSTSEVRPNSSDSAPPSFPSPCHSPPSLPVSSPPTVIASFQPTHATSDMSYAESKLGPDRIKTAYAWQSVLSAGGRIALGSDFPIESADPMLGFYAAVTRLSPAEPGTSPHGPGGWYPEEKLTRFQTLKGMTLDAAYASFSENVTVSPVRPLFSRSAFTFPARAELERVKRRD